MKCQHEGCDGELEYCQDMEEKGRFGVFECNKCHCKFSIVDARKEVGCPSLRAEKKKGTKVYVNVGEGSQPVVKEAFVGKPDVVENKGDQQIIKDLKTNSGDQKLLEYIQNTPVKRGRGRPKGSKNKK